jgi:serine/threonine protein kinase
MTLHLFEQELEILKKVSDLPGFSKLIDRGVSNNFQTQGLDIEDNTRFMIMEKLGTSVMDILEKLDHKINKIDVLKIGIELLNLIETLHSKEIVHKDIKPDNILLDRNFEDSDILQGYETDYFEKLDELQRQGKHLMKTE